MYKDSNFNHSGLAKETSHDTTDRLFDNQSRMKTNLIIRQSRKIKAW